MVKLGIDRFCLIVHLKVVGCAKLSFNSKVLTQCLPEQRDKLGTVVLDDVRGGAVEVPNVV